MRTLDLTVLAFDGPVVRAYLSGLREAGFSPRKIVHVHFERPGIKLRLVSSILGRSKADVLFHKYRDRSLDTAERRDLLGRMPRTTIVPPDFLSPPHYPDYCEDVEYLYVDGFDDPRLAERLASEPCKTFLFTGGGILGRNLLELAGCRFIHVHPGIVPHVRGSDGLFWSILLRGRPGASCFYMNSGIDTGDVIATREFERPRLDPEMMRHGSEAAYWALREFYDPLLRTETLIHVIERAGTGADLGRLPCVPQDRKRGRSFYSMHPRLRDRVLDLWLKDNGPSGLTRMEGDRR